MLAIFQNEAGRPEPGGWPGGLVGLPIVCSLEQAPVTMVPIHRPRRRHLHARIAFNVNALNLSSRMNTTCRAPYKIGRSTCMPPPLQENAILLDALLVVSILPRKFKEFKLKALRA